MSKDDTDTKPVLMGVIGATHGVRGQVRIKSFTGDPLAIGDYGPLHDKSGNSYEITHARMAKNMVIATIKSVTTPEAAKALNGVELFVARDQLPDEELDEDEFFFEDLVGMEARAEDGDVLGRVIAVYNFGADDMIEVRFSSGPKAGKSEYFAFLKSVVPDLNLEEGWLTLVMPDEVIAQGDEAEEGEGDEG